MLTKEKVNISLEKYVMNVWKHVDQQISIVSPVLRT